MAIVVTILHVLACLALIMIVLLQTGKGADLGAAFGGSSQTVFGSQGAGGFLAKLTTTMAVVFMITSLSLTFISAKSGQSTVMEDIELPEAAVPSEVPQGEVTPLPGVPSDSADRQQGPGEDPAGTMPESPESSPAQEGASADTADK